MNIAVKPTQSQKVFSSSRNSANSQSTASLSLLAKWEEWITEVSKQAKLWAILITLTLVVLEIKLFKISTHLYLLYRKIWSGSFKGDESGSLFEQTSGMAYNLPVAVKEARETSPLTYTYQPSV